MNPQILWLFLTLVNVKLTFSYSDVKVILYEDEGRIPAVHSGDECESILFNAKKGITCACVTGVWAFYNSLCSSPYSIVGGNNYCFKIIGNSVSRVSLLSTPNSTYESSLAWISKDSRQTIEKFTGSSDVDWELKDSMIITTGEFSWELTSNKGEKLCLSHLNPKSYCQFSELGTYKIKSIKQHCRSTKNLIQPTSCQEYFDSNDETNICNTELSEEEDLTQSKVTLFNPIEIITFDEFQSLIEPSIRLSRVKRQADAGAPAPSPPDAGGAGAATNTTGGDAGGNNTSAAGAAKNETDPEIEDEDYIDPEQLKVVNNPLIVEQLKINLDALIASVTGATSSFEPDLRMPILKLLQICVGVMAKTCDVLDKSYYDTAFNTFVNVQTQSLHVKEPYITQTQYTRIMMALSSCESEAREHKFQTSTNSTAKVGPCEQSAADNATNILLKNGIYHNLTVEPDKSGLGFEPIIESVWKIFLNAHSYCYKYFSEYYNDHHTFAVTLLPMFTNEIQNIWMNSTSNGTYVEPAEALLIYGGLIGDHRSVINNIDLCVAASRVDSAYPWLMNRPPRDDTNKWVRRKKRSIVPTDELCLKEADETNTVLSKIRCT